MRLGKYLSGLTKPELEVFIEQCNFTDDEQEVFRLLCAGKQTCYMSMRLNISEATVNRRIKAIKSKVERIDRIGMQSANLGKIKFVD